jgi:hypothetical protein
MDSPSGLDGGEHDLKTKIDQVHVGHRDRNFPQYNGSFVEDAVQGLAERYTLAVVLGVTGIAVGIHRVPGLSW